MTAKIGNVAGRLPIEIVPYLDTIKRIVLRKSIEFYAKHEWLRKERMTKGSRPEHNGDDEAILAKCIALSYGGEVRLISHDIDFRYLHEAVYDGLEDLARNGLNSLPAHPVELALVRRNWDVEFFMPRRRTRRLAKMTMQKSL